MKGLTFKAILLGFLFHITLLSKPLDTASFKLAELVITGLKYPEKILELPMSVSFIRSHELKAYRGISIEDAFTKVPGILVQSRSGTQDIRLTVRGFGARGAGDRSNSGTIRGIRLLLDGIPQTEPDGRTSLDFFDLSFIESIEILRSNSSSLWGNAAGGVLNFSTVPEISSTSLVYSFSAGSYGLNKNVLKFRTPLNQSGAVFYVNSLYSKFDGWRENSNAERFLVNIGLKDKISSKTNFLLNINFGRNFFAIPGAITQVAYDSLPNSANPRYLANKERRNNRLMQISATMNHNFDDNNSLEGWGFLTAKYLQRSERGTFRDFTRYFLGSSVNYKNNSKFFGIENIFLAGYENTLQDGAILFYNLDENGNRSTTLNTNKREGAQTFGLFAQNEIIYDKLSFIFGIRNDWVNYTSQDFLLSNNSNSKTFSRWTPKIALGYRVAENLSIYGNIGGGLEVPAGNETNPTPYETDSTIQINPLLEPIISNTFELGTKGYFDFGKIIRTFEFDFATFLIDVRNELVPYREGRFYLSAGKTQRLGFEGAFKLVFSPKITLEGSVTYMHHKFTDYKVDSGYYDVNKQGIIADYSNNKLPGVPNLFYYFGLTVPFFLNFQLNIQGVGKYFADDANTIEVPSYNILNFKVWFDKIFIGNFAQIQLAFSANNLSDSKYVGSAFINPEREKGTKLPFFIEPGLPRNFVFNVTVNFAKQSK